MRRLALGSLVLALLLPLGAAHAQPTRGDTGLRIGFRGWGALKLGMSPREGRATGLVSREASPCSGQLMPTEPYRDRVSYLWSGSGTKRRLHDIVVWGGTVDQTRKGAHRGTTLRTLKKTYPALSDVHHSSYVTGHRQGKGDDFYLAFVHRKRGTITFQFAYGDRPTGSSPVDTIVVSRKPAIYPGC